MSEIGATLREARMRARIDISEIEAQTKIRAKYLRALENEEWDLLPGSTYVKTFLRTYAQALGLDPRPLLEDYRRDFERPSETEYAPISPPGRRPPPSPAGFHFGVNRVWVGIILLVVLFALIGILKAGSGGGPKANTTASTPPPTTSTTSGARTGTTSHAGRGATGSAGTQLATLELIPTGPVSVCLWSATGSKLLDSVTLQPLSAGQHPHQYHSHHFLLELGNNSLSMRVNHHLLSVPASSTAIGYRITPSGRHSVSLSSLPACP
jgi:cytoskeleton protein RodZ